MFVDKLSLLIIAKNLEDLQMTPLSVLNHKSKWFLVNGLSLNIDKTYVIPFM
jgi:hypothetical protein